MFCSHVKAALDGWSEVAELGQYGRILTGTLASVSGELGEASARYTRTVVNLQSALASFESVSDADRQRFLEALADVADRFSYTPPAELAQLAVTSPAVPYAGLPAGDGADGSSTAGDARAEADRARAHANAGRAGHGHP